MKAMSGRIAMIAALTGLVLPVLALGGCGSEPSGGLVIQEVTSSASTTGAGLPKGPAAAGAPGTSASASSGRTGSASRASTPGPTSARGATTPGKANGGGRVNSKTNPPAPPAVGNAPVVLPGLTPSGLVTMSSGQTIRGLRITNPNGPCVVVPPDVTDVTIADSEIGPCGSTADDDGVNIQPGATRVTVTGNIIHDVASGVYARLALNPILVEGNRVYNVRGPLPRGQMVQFDSVTGDATSRIVGNVSDKNAATITTHYEDHISLYRSAGTAAHPIEIACNKIRGGDSITGAAITVGDNGGGYADIHDNVVILTPSSGISIAGAHDLSITRNLVYNRGGSASSHTNWALTIFSYASNTPRNVTVTGNRALAAMWLDGYDGQVGPGMWSDGSGSNIVSSGNSWQDGSLSSATWDTTPPSCL